MPMQSYLIAKYVDDIRRNEPVNVGVIVFDGEQVLARFEGEDDAQAIDKRRIRRIGGRDAYVAWVQHWRRLLQAIDHSDPNTSIDAVMRHAGSQDFYVEPGGTILLDTDERDLAESVRDLYARLVKPEDLPSPPSLKQKSKTALRLAGAVLDDVEQFKENVDVKVEVGGEVFDDRFSYAVKNGAWHFLQEVSFDPQKLVKSRKEANNCAFLMEHAITDGDGLRLVLFDSADIDEQTEPLLARIRKIAPGVVVGEPDAAALALRTQLHIGQ
jgi:hypothetical protein